MDHRSTLFDFAALCLPLATPASAQEGGAPKPNILVIWGDDIGRFNLSAYNLKRVKGRADQ